jgi:L-fuconolactonase
MAQEAIHVVDSHVHFWDPERFHYPWLDSEPALLRPFGPAELKPQGYVVDALVFVQADARADEALAEVRWVQDLAIRHPAIQGVIAHAPLQEGRSLALQAVAAEELVVGVRQLLQDEPAGFALRPGYVEGVRRAGELGLVVDLCIRWHQLADAIALTGGCPDVTFVLDHLGKPPIAANSWEPWASGLSALAANPNVHCKLSGLTSEAGGSWPTQVGPYLAHALNVFGPRRCLFGSDWPVVTNATTYERWLDVVVMAIAARLSPMDFAGVLRDNTRTVYGLAAGQPTEP